MSDVLEQIKREISARIEELRPLVAEAAQLEDAIGALNGSPPHRGRGARDARARMTAPHGAGVGARRRAGRPRA